MGEERYDRAPVFPVLPGFRFARLSRRRIMISLLNNLKDIIWNWLNNVIST